MDSKELALQYGAHYWYGEDAAGHLIGHGPDDLYAYRVCGKTEILKVGQNETAYVIDADGNFHCVTDRTMHNIKFACVILGYIAPNALRSGERLDTNLPYVNGCSTEQIFPPIRAGDPTMQLLYIPPYTAEQAHHIHSTVRAVYVLSGKGVSVVGQEGATATNELVPGAVCVLEKMAPHHFETGKEGLRVIPVHVFSSIGGGEYNHPMFNGTYLTDK